MILNSIRTKILFFGLVFLVLIGSAFFVYSMITTVNFKRMRLETIEKTVAYETEKVNKVITEIEHSAVIYAIGGMLSYKTLSVEFGENLAIEYTNNFPVLRGGGFWFEPYAFKDYLRAGFYAFSENAIGTVIPYHNVFMDEFDYHDASWYREIISNLKEPYQVVWIKPYFDSSGSSSLMTTAGAGMFDDTGKLIGLTTADWEIDEVIRELNAIKPTENSFILLCVPAEDYVISSTRTNAVIGASIQEIPWDINADAFHFNGIEYLRFGKYTDNGWLLSVQIPVNEIFADIERQNGRFSVIIAVVFLIMLFVAWLLISRLINAPITKLTAEVSQIALGNLEEKIKVSSKDELGLLAQVFNKMTSDLKNSIEEKEKEQKVKESIRAELSVAAEIQSSMLPCVFPPFPARKEFELFAMIDPARDVCGDFYDFFFVDDDNLAVLIADVSGKGVPAALFMVVAKTLIKNCSSCKSPMAVFDSVNKKLCDGNESGMFVTAFIGFYNIPTGKLTFVNAGHNPPLLKKKRKFEYLSTRPCLVLGFLKDAKYHEEEIFLEPDDILFLYTDGVTEAMNRKNELFGENRLHHAANKYINSPINDLLNAIKFEIDVFVQGAQQADDITMLTLRITNGKEENKDSTEQSPLCNGEVEIYNQLNVEAKSENLDSVIIFIKKELENTKYSQEVKNEICIAVEEIFMNITYYAYEKNTGKVLLSIKIGDKTQIRFEDSGRPYNPLEQPSPDFNPDISDRKIGGLGIFMVKKLMDSVEYSRISGKNIILLTKQ